MHLKTTVIIPVYNASRWIAKAVRSAVQQPEAERVLLIEDGSADSSLDTCRRLSREYANVEVLQHPGGENRGAGASRNLGIRAATTEWVAFLDADDYYLPGRFREDAEVIARHPDSEGVYNAIGFDYYEEKDSKQSLQKHQNLTTIPQPVPPDQLKDVLLRRHPQKIIGHISCNGLTVKRRLFDRSGLFNDLKIGEDTHLIIRLAFAGKLYPGELRRPVAMRRVHGNNRITNRKPADKFLFHESLLDWALQASISPKYVRGIFLKYLFHHPSRKRQDGSPIAKGWEIARTFLQVAKTHPEFIRKLWVIHTAL